MWRYKHKVRKISMIDNISNRVVDGNFYVEVISKKDYFKNNS